MYYPVKDCFSRSTKREHITLREICCGKCHVAGNITYTSTQQKLCDMLLMPSTVEPGYNNIGLYDTSSITSNILWYQLITHC
jgi:hypothetical protein